MNSNNKVGAPEAPGTTGMTETTAGGGKGSSIY